MQRASELFTDEQKARIRDAVVAAEARTSAEVVPVVATASGRYDRPEDIVGLGMAVVAMIVVWWFLPGARAAGSWGGFPPALQVLAMAAAVLAGFAVGATVASYVGWLRRLFTPRTQMADEVGARARQAFFDSSVHRTRGGTGVLIYVSLFERMAAVLGDQAVIEKLGQEAIEELRDQLISDLAHGEADEALRAVIETAGLMLGEALPRDKGDVNELPNDLVIID